jgi:hypothetical protein
MLRSEISESAANIDCQTWLRAHATINNPAGRKPEIRSRFSNSNEEFFNLDCP